MPSDPGAIRTFFFPLRCDHPNIEPRANTVLHFIPYTSKTHQEESLANLMLIHLFTFLFKSFLDISTIP